MNLQNPNMDRLKLAQFNKISNEENDQGYHFLKSGKINVDSSVSSESRRQFDKNDYAGYNYLHFAAKKSDLTSIDELISRKADLVKQASEDGKTALHIVGNRFRNEAYNYYVNATMYEGKPKENKFVETLLAAQVETGIAVNPKSNDGTSHLHIACMYNHIKAVELFLMDGESVDHATNDSHQLPGYTALHFAVRYSAFEAAELLLKHGANIHLKDAAGKSALHLLIERLMVIANYLAIGQRKYCPFYEQERDTLEAILGMFLKNKRAEDVLDDTSLTLLHAVCIFKESTAIKSILKQNMDVNVATRSQSDLWPGWSPLHFATCFSVETFKFLLRNGADLNLKNTVGDTPLDLCMQRYSPFVVHSILSTKDEFKAILFSDGSTRLLDAMLSMSNDDMFRVWVKRLTNVDITLPSDSPIWPGCNLLNLSVLNERMELPSNRKEKMIFEIEIFGPSHEPGLTHCWRRIMDCLLAKPYNFLYTENADGLSPFRLAVERRKVTSVNAILDSIVRLNESKPNGRLYFHVACAAGNTKAIERFATQGVSLNEPVASEFRWYARNSNVEVVHVPSGSTPLHIAVIARNCKLVEYLLANGADMRVEDRSGLEPMHLSLIDGNPCYFSITNKFFAKTLSSERFVTTRNAMDARNRHSLLLYMAVICDDGPTVTEILHRVGKSVICEPFDPTNPKLRSAFSEDLGKTPLHVALSRGYNAAHALINGGVDVFADYSSESLNLAVKRGFHSNKLFLSQLKRKRRASAMIERTGVTLLHVACDKCDVEWTKTLLRRGADPNARVAASSDDSCVFQNGFTPLDVFARSAFRCFDDRSDTVAVLEALIERGADATCVNGDDGKTPIHALYYKAVYSTGCFRQDREDRLSAMDILLNSQRTYDVNPMDPHGLSHFHLACYRNHLEIVKRFLDCGVDVNHAYDPFAKIERHAGYTPLHFALDQGKSDVARLLIERGANVEAEDVQGDTPLHVAVKQGFVDAELIGLILRHGGDINVKNVKGTSPIEYLLMSKDFTLQQFGIMLDRGAAIDLIKIQPSGAGIIGLAMLNAEPNDRLHVCKRIINACDVERVIEQGANLVDSAVNVKQNGQLTVELYLEVIEQLVDAGCDLNQRDSEGKTTLHRATSLYNHEAVKALLLVGANWNAVDNYGEPSLTRKVINDEQSMRRRTTLIILTTEIWKINNMGLYVNEATKKALFQAIDHFPTLNFINYHAVKARCLSDSNKTRTIFLNELTLEKFLSESQALIQYSRMPEPERQVVDAFFKCGDNVRRGFPELGGFLTMQYRKAVARTRMLRPAMQVIFFAGIKLPALCLAEIVQNLKHNELELLFRTF